MKNHYDELSKLYPKFKIPVSKHTGYYIETLLKAKEINEIPLNNLLDIMSKYLDIGKYKMQMLDKILNYFKENDWDLNKLDYKSSLFDKEDYELKEFNDFKFDKFYISVDLRSANWQSFKLAFDLELPDWNIWTKSTFDLHPFISESKSFRQLLFGNTNPKRLQTIQQVMMKNLEKEFSEETKEKIVSRKSDELVFEFDAFQQPEFIEFNDWTTSVTYFKVELVESLGEMIKLKHEFDYTGKKVKIKMINVSGNRYFIHLKNLILKEKVDERDLYFIVEKKLAKWVIE